MTDERVEVDVERMARYLHMSPGEVEVLLKEMEKPKPDAAMTKRLESIARMTRKSVAEVQRFLEGLKNDEQK